MTPQNRAAPTDTAEENHALAFADAQSTELQQITRSGNSKAPQKGKYAARLLQYLRYAHQRGLLIDMERQRVHLGT